LETNICCETTTFDPEPSDILITDFKIARVLNLYPERAEQFPCSPLELLRKSCSSADLINVTETTGGFC
jgi:hypothetical protein